MIDGSWEQDDVAVTDARGRFVRRAAHFRQGITADGSSGFPAVAGRYHLYVAWACPWAHRVVIARELLGLQDAISLCAAHALMAEDGWVFAPGRSEIPDEVERAEYLYQIYQRADPTYSGRVTVPVLWDTVGKTIVSNESRDILRMMGTQMRGLSRGDLDLAPADLQPKIDEVIDAIYEPINNGVYRAGFARTQGAHDEAVRGLFAALDHWERVLGHQRWLCGDRLTEADLCLFTTLFRFDIVYVTHFKCNIRRLVDYPNLWGFTRALYQLPGVAQTCHVDHVKLHYFGSHPSVNPRGLVPLGPAVDFSAPHDRG